MSGLPAVEGFNNSLPTEPGLCKDVSKSSSFELHVWVQYNLRIAGVGDWCDREKQLLV